MTAPLGAPPLDVRCPKCGAPPRERCRSSVDRQPTAAHTSRVEDSARRAVEDTDR